MTQGIASKEEAKECEKALEEIMEAIPKTKKINFMGHFNDLFLFLSACKNTLPSEAEADNNKEIPS